MHVRKTLKNTTVTDKKKKATSLMSHICILAEGSLRCLHVSGEVERSKPDYSYARSYVVKSHSLQDRFVFLFVMNLLLPRKEFVNHLKGGRSSKRSHKQRSPGTFPPHYTDK